MNERAYARREAMRNNNIERNISPRRITQWDFINQAVGSVLCSGIDAPLLGNALIQGFAAGYPRDHRTTILLTGSADRMQFIHELVSRGMPALYFDSSNQNYHAMFRQSAASIREQIHAVASRTMSGSALDDLMRFLSVVITLTGHFYPLSLQSISALLQLPHYEIVQLARDAGLSEDLINILNRSSDTCQDLRIILDSAEYAFSGISNSGVENSVNLLTAVQHGVPMIVLWQLGIDQETLNRSIAEDLRSVIYTNHRIRVIIDSVTFRTAEDPLLTFLVDYMRSGLLDLVVISTSAADMLQNDRYIGYFPNIFLSIHETQANTERHTSVFGEYYHSQENLVVQRRRPFHIHQDRQWSISDSSRLRIRAADLLPTVRPFSRQVINVVCQVGPALYLVDRHFFFRQ